MAAGRPLKLTLGQRDAFAHAWADPGVTTAAIALRFGMSLAAAYSMARRLDLRRRA